MNQNVCKYKKIKKNLFVFKQDIDHEYGTRQKLFNLTKIVEVDGSKIKKSSISTTSRNFVRKELSRTSMNDVKKDNDGMSRNLLSITKIEFTGNKRKLSSYRTTRNFIRKERYQPLINKRKDNDDENNTFVQSVKSETEKKKQ